eukprot:4278905-Pleurochrysis_carterae.AAC.1
MRDHQVSRGSQGVARGNGHCPTGWGPDAQCEAEDKKRGGVGQYVRISILAKGGGRDVKNGHITKGIGKRATRIDTLTEACAGLAFSKAECPSSSILCTTTTSRSSSSSSARSRHSSASRVAYQLSQPRT